MGYVVWKLLVLLVVVSIVACAGNATAPAGTTAATGAGVTETKHTGAVSSLVKMIIDIPMGIVEAFKDGADAIESMVVAFMRGVFSK